MSINLSGSETGNSKFTDETSDILYLENENLTYLTIVKSSIISSAMLELSAINNDVKNVSVDICDDGILDWAFPERYGKFGNANSFQNGEEIINLLLVPNEPSLVNVSIPESEINSGNVVVSASDVVSYSAWLNLSIGGNVISCIPFDYDNDGKLEIFLCNGSLVLLDINETGEVSLSQFQFSDVKTFEVCDVDYDGYEEIIVCNESGIQIFKYSNIELYAGEGINCININDLNKDGKKDILVGCENGSIIRFDYLGYDEFGNMQFSSPNFYNLGSSVKALSICDIDRNGSNDIVSACSEGVFLLKNTEQGYSIEQMTSGNALSIDTKDMDNDGKIEIAVGLENGTIILLNENVTFYKIGNSPVTALKFADVNYDSKQEIIASCDNLIFFNIQTYQIEKSEYASKTFCIGDFNKDGGLDMCNSNINLLSILKGELPSAVSIDLEIGNIPTWNSLSSQGAFSNGTSAGNAQTNLFSMTFGDIDLDGRTDLIGGDRNANFFISYNRENGFEGLTVPGASYMDRIMNTVVVFDADSDGDLDLAGSEKYGTVYFCKNNRESFSNSRVIGNIGKKLLSLKDIDINSDGRKDLAWCSDTQIGVLKNLDGTNFTKYVFLNTPSQISSMDIADIDFDGKNEFILAFSNGTISIIGNVSAEGEPELSFNNITGVSNQNKIKVSDIDSDGDLDIVISSNGIYFVENLRSAFSSPSLFAQTSSLTSISTADLDSDGVLDILCSENNIFRAFLRGSQKNFSLPGNGLSLYDVAPLDIDYDGDLDLLGAGYSGSFRCSKNNLKTYGDMYVNFTNSLRTYVSNSTSNNDEWGNPIVTIPLKLSSLYNVNISLSKLNITYNYNVHLNILPQINAYVSAHPANDTGFVKVPVRISSATSGNLKISVSINYIQCAPWLGAPIPDTYSFAEDTYAYHLIDLEKYFFDDKDDGNLSFFVSYEEEPSELHAIVDGRYLNFQVKPHWSGSHKFAVKAIDREGLEFISNMFSVTVYDVNHPPVFSNFPSTLRLVENQSSWLNLSQYVTDIDGDTLTFATSDPNNVTIHPNGSAEMRFSDAGYEQDIAFSVSDGNHTTIAYILIRVMPFGAPVWGVFPDYCIPKGCNITEQNANYSLRGFVYDENTPINNLTFSIISIDGAPAGTNVSISNNGMILVSKPKNYVGTFTVTLRVSDGTYFDDTVLRITVLNIQYPPIYLGGISDAVVDEDTTWSIDLSQYFLNPDAPGMLYYSSNSNMITIAGSIASWTPKTGNINITNLIFYAYDMENTTYSANSTPIKLTSREVNDRPIYLGGLQSAIIYEGMNWSINLTRYFSDEEMPSGLRFICNNQNITITPDGFAKWSPKVGDKNITNLIFTAVDALNDSLSISSNPINLIFVPKNKPPTAQIIKIYPANPTTSTLIHFEGTGFDEDGHIIGWEWRSDTGWLEHSANFSCKLWAGTHKFSFRVEDDKGLWSAPVYSNITVLNDVTSKPIKQMPYLVIALLSVAAILIFSGLLLNIRGRKRLKRIRYNK